MITIESHHNGPPGSAHGGVAAGLLAALVDADRAVIRFHSPPPVGEALLRVPNPSGSVDVFAGSRRVATVTAGPPLDVEPFTRLDAHDVSIAEATWLEYCDGHHPFPTCFGCGPDRTDGLGLTPGAVAGSSVHATSWTPSHDGPVPSWLVWAALDCPSGGPAVAAVPAGSAVVTGQLAVDIREQLSGGEPYQIISRCTARSGRKMTTQAAIVDRAGRNVAVAEATWIAISSESALAS